MQACEPQICTSIHALVIRIMECRDRIHIQRDQIRKSLKRAKHRRACFDKTLNEPAWDLTAEPAREESDEQEETCRP